MQLGYDEVFAFWAILSKEEGGISFSPLHIGTANAFAGVGMLLMQMFAYVPMDKALGTRHVLTLSMAAITPPILFVSYANLFYDNRVLLWILVGLVMMLKAGFGTTGFGSVNLLVSNAAGSETVGAVNGLSASVAALARVIAPVFLGSVFAASAKAHSFPFDIHFVFFLMALIAALISAGSHFLLPQSINKRAS